MADVADGRAGADAWPGASLRDVQHRQGAVRRRALPEGGPSALQGSQYAAAGSRIRRRPVFDRRYRDLAVDLALRMADDRYEAVSERQALVRNHCGAPGRAKGLQSPERHGSGADADVTIGPAWTKGIRANTLLYDSPAA